MKLILKRTVSLFLIFTLASVILGCKDKTTTTTAVTPENLLTPSLSDPNTVFFQGNGYSVTYGEIYEEFKINDGITQLTSMVDLDLLSDYLSAVTPDAIAKKILYLTYGTDVAEEIAELDAETKAKNEKDYVDNMQLLGYSGKEETYVRLICAKEQYSIDQLYDVSNNDETWYIGDSTIAKYYMNSYFEDVSAIKIRFFSLEDANQVMRHFNLLTKNSKLLLYTGTVPLDQVPTSSLDSSNTRELTNPELLTSFIQMYNYVYGGYRSLISETATLTELKALPELVFAYEDLVKTQSSLTAFLFSTLSDYETYAAGGTTNRCYTVSPAKYYGTSDTSTYMILKLSAPEKEDLSEYDPDTDGALSAIIGETLYAELREEMKNNNLATTDYYSNRLVDLRTEHEFTINDYYLGIDYQGLDIDYKVTKTGHSTVVATYKKGSQTVEITADELLAYGLGNNASLYSLYAAQMEYAMVTYFPEVYCQGSETCELDVTKNTSAKLEEHWDTLEEMKTSFEESYYAMYYTFEQFMYLAYGARSEAELVSDYYIKATLQPYLIYDELKSDDWSLLEDYLYPLIQDYYDNYFSLSVDMITIYVDRNEDGIADVYADFVSGLTDPAAFATTISALEADIREYLADGTKTAANLVTQYNTALRTNETWGDYKELGIYLKTEDLSSESSLTYLTAVDKYEDVLLEAFLSAYQEYQLEANKGLDYMIYSQDIVVAGGVSLLYCQKGTGFTKPSAKFTMLFDSNNQPLYDLGSANDSDLPSLAQLKLYCEYRFYEIVYGTEEDAETTYNFEFPEIPAIVITALEAYFQDLHDSMYVVGFLNLIMADMMQTGTFSNANTSYCTISDAALKARITSLRAIYFDQVFAEYDTVDE